VSICHHRDAIEHPHAIDDEGTLARDLVFAAEQLEQRGNPITP
jgi:hypothetical protein